MTAPELPAVPTELYWSPSLYVTHGWGLCFSNENGVFVRPGRLPEDAVRLVPEASKGAPSALELVDHLDIAWGVIANAGGWGRGGASPGWLEAAERWRDRWHVLLHAWCETHPEQAARPVLRPPLDEMAAADKVPKPRAAIKVRQPRACLNCGAMFTGRQDKKVCSMPCRAALTYRRRKGRE